MEINVATAVFQAPALQTVTVVRKPRVFLGMDLWYKHVLGVAFLPRMVWFLEIPPTKDVIISMKKVEVFCTLGFLLTCRLLLHKCQGQSSPYIGDGHPTCNDGNPHNGYILPRLMGWWLSPTTGNQWELIDPSTYKDGSLFFNLLRIVFQNQVWRENNKRASSPTIMIQWQMDTSNGKNGQTQQNSRNLRGDCFSQKRF